MSIFSEQFQLRSSLKIIPVGIIAVEHEHLEQIKSNVNFYATVNAKLEFNLKDSLKTNQAFWNTYFPGKRDASNQVCDTSSDFVNILEVRNIFKEFEAEVLGNGQSSLNYSTPDINQRENCEII